jgi:hypothetical protein
MTVVQFPPRTPRPNVIPLAPAGITKAQFEVAHELADEMERMPLTSDAVAMFIAAARARLTEVSGDIETELQAMSNEQLFDMHEAMEAITHQDKVDIEDDFIGDLVAFEVSRRDAGGSFTPDGAA